MNLKEVVYGSAGKVQALWDDRTDTARSLRFVCGAAAILGALLLVLIEVFEPGPQWPTILDKLALDGAVALMIAALVGATYEAYRERLSRREHHVSMIETIGEFAKPEHVLQLVADVVEQLPYVPTLFRPARLETKEYNFIKDHDLLHYLLMFAESRPGDSVLRKWLFESTDPKLRFLASDVVGLHQIKKYAYEMERLADERIAGWESVAPNDWWWVLNYKWAASRCARSPYDSLTTLLLQTDRPEIQRWVLFVPCQMPSVPLCGLVEQFLEKRATSALPDVLAVALDALARLDLVQSMSEILTRYSDDFLRAALKERLVKVRIEMKNRREQEREELRNWQDAAQQRHTVDIRLDL